MLSLSKVGSKSAESVLKVQVHPKCLRWECSVFGIHWFISVLFHCHFVCSLILFGQIWGYKTDLYQINSVWKSAISWQLSWIGKLNQIFGIACDKDLDFVATVFGCQCPTCPNVFK